MPTLGMGKRASVIFGWDRGEVRKANLRDSLRAKTARLIPIELPEPDEQPWLWDCPPYCDCQSCETDRRDFDDRSLRVVGAPPERQPDCDLPDCPMCFAARKWLPESDGRTLEQWRRQRERVSQ